MAYKLIAGGLMLLGGIPFFLSLLGLLGELLSDRDPQEMTELLHQLLLSASTFGIGVLLWAHMTGNDHNEPRR